MAIPRRICSTTKQSVSMDLEKILSTPVYLHFSSKTLMVWMYIQDLFLGVQYISLFSLNFAILGGIPGKERCQYFAHPTIRPVSIDMASESTVKRSKSTKLPGGMATETPVSTTLSIATKVGWISKAACVRTDSATKVHWMAKYGWKLSVVLFKTKVGGWFIGTKNVFRTALYQRSCMTHWEV